MPRDLLGELEDRQRQQRERGGHVNTITERVERGAALLDERIPGWWKWISLPRLQVESKCDCVLGQLAGGRLPSLPPRDRFGEGLHLAGVEPFRAQEYGFDSDADQDALDCMPVLEAERREDEEFEALTKAWRGLIRQRRELDAVTG